MKALKADCIITSTTEVSQSFKQETFLVPAGFDSTEKSVTLSDAVTKLNLYRFTDYYFPRLYSNPSAT